MLPLPESERIEILTFKSSTWKRNAATIGNKGQ